MNKITHNDNTNEGNEMLSFYNAGIINEISITTFGINAKNDDSAIGYFGTGLKYAIAVLLRNGHEIKIKSGLNLSTRGRIRSESASLKASPDAPAKRGALTIVS